MPEDKDTNLNTNTEENIISEEVEVVADNNKDNEETPPESESECEIPTKKPQSWLSSLLDYVEIFVFAVCAVILVFSFFVKLCKVKGPSMENTLFDGELLLISDVLYEPERGDIIVFHQTGFLNEPIVKRVIATGGETVDIDFSTWTVTVTDVDGNTFVVDEPYMYLEGDYPYLLSNYSFPYKVPEGELFVMGDNRNHSTDSRSYLIGTVDERRVLGKVIFRLTPIDKIGTVK